MPNVHALLICLGMLSCCSEIAAANSVERLGKGQEAATSTAKPAGGNGSDPFMSFADQGDFEGMLRVTEAAETAARTRYGAENPEVRLQELGVESLRWVVARPAEERAEITAAFQAWRAAYTRYGASDPSEDRLEEYNSASARCASLVGAHSYVVSKIFLRRATDLRQRGLAEKAEPLFVQAELLMRHSGGDDGEAIARTEHAANLFILRRYEEAVACANLAVAVFAERWGDNIGIQAVAFLAIAEAENGRGNHADAASAAQRGIALFSKPEHREIGGLLVGLRWQQAIAYKNLENGAAAIVAIENIVLFAKSYPDQIEGFQSNARVILRYYGAILRALDNHAGALEMEEYLARLATRRPAAEGSAPDQPKPSPGHNADLPERGDWAQLPLDREDFAGELRAAEADAKRAMVRFGPDHPATAVANATAASFRRVVFLDESERERMNSAIRRMATAAGKYEADRQPNWLSEYDSAIADFAETIGEPNVRVALVRIIYGAHLRHWGLKEQSRVQFSAAEATYRALAGADGEAFIRLPLAGQLLRTGDFNEAAELARKASLVLEDRWSTNYRPRINCFKILAEAEKECGNVAEAIDAAVKGIPLCLFSGPPDLESYLVLRWHQSGALVRCGETQSSRMMVDEMISLAELIPEKAGEFRPRLIALYEVRAGWQRDSGDVAAAARDERKAEELRAKLASGSETSAGSIVPAGGEQTR